MNFLKNLFTVKSFLISMLGFIIALSSCKSTKKIQAAITKKDTTSVHITNLSAEDSTAIFKKEIALIQSKKIDIKTFNSKIKVEYQDSKGKQPGITAYVRIIKDSVIWISGYATVFNIEAFRALITKDSVIVIDKINKEVQYRSIEYLQELVQIPFDFTTFQDLILGNPIFFNDSVVSYRETESKILVATVGKYFKHLLTISKATQNIIHTKLDDIDINQNRTADITYDEYENNMGLNFSTYREITVSEKNKLDIQLKYKQYEFNKELQLNFTIPKNFKRR